MKNRLGSLTFGLALACTVLLAAGCSKSSTSTGSGGGGGGTFADLVGFWYQASDSSGIEIRSDSTLHPLTVDVNGRLVYSSDTVGFAMRLTKAEGGQMTGTVHITIVGVVDTTFPMSGTYSLSADKNTMTSTMTGPFGSQGQTETQTSTAVRSSYNAQVLTGGGGGGGGTVGVSFSSNKGDFSCDTTYAEARPAHIGMFYSLMIEGFKMNSSTSYDDVTIEISDTSAIVAKTYALVSSAYQTVQITFNLGFNPTDPSHGQNECVLTSGTVTITSITSTNCKGTFSGTGTRTGDGSSVTLTNGTFDVPVH